MDTPTLATWLAEKKWELAAGVAEDLLTRDLPPAERALAHYAACKSYSNLGRYSQALAHGYAAAAAAGDLQSFDLVGKTLLELAFVQQQLGRHEDALASLEAFGRHLPSYSDDLVKAGLAASLNRGVALRSIGEYERALGEFLQGMQKAHQTGDVATREYCRAQATWVALELRHMPQAEDLLAQGDAYLKRFPDDRRARSWQFHDKAWLARLRGQAHQSAVFALEAACAAGDNLELLAYALWALHLAGMQLGDVEAAFKVGLLAKQLAEVADNPILLERLSDALTQVVLQHRSVVDRIGQETIQTRGIEG